ncbi:MAG: hypothetical protein ACFB9N_05020 [Geitlerinemataceae cyanobacterium]
MSQKEDFLNIPFDAEVVSESPAPQRQQPTRSASAGSGRKQRVKNLYKQQGRQFLDRMTDEFAGGVGRAQNTVWEAAGESLVGLPGLLLRCAEIGGIVFFLTWFPPNVFERFVHDPIGRHVVQSVEPGDGFRYNYDGSLPFRQQHWSLQARVNDLVVPVAFALGIFVIVFVEPKTGSSAALKWRLLVVLFALV